MTSRRDIERRLEDLGRESGDGAPESVVLVNVDPETGAVFDDLVGDDPLTEAPEADCLVWRLRTISTTRAEADTTVYATITERDGPNDVVAARAPYPESVPEDVLTADDLNLVVEYDDTDTSAAIDFRRTRT